ncbi:hypothetical protein Q5O05_26200 [Trinickia caryophylli]|nr:hypothetical protein [Trinickia caryophylli]
MLFDAVSVHASTELPSARGAMIVGVSSLLGATLPPTATLVDCARWSNVSQMVADHVIPEQVISAMPAEMGKADFMMRFLSRFTGKVVCRGCPYCC